MRCSISIIILNIIGGFSALGWNHPGFGESTVSSFAATCMCVQLLRIIIGPTISRSGV